MLNEREPHTALQANILAKCDSEDLSLVLARLQWSKSEIRYSLHASPKKMYSMWLPWEDFFSLAGFYRAARCAFLGRDCHVRWVTEGIDLARFEQLSGRGLSGRRVAILQDEGLIAPIGNSRLRATPAGMIVLDALVADLAR